MSDGIPIVLAADERYAMQLAVALASIATAPGTTTYRAFVLHDGLPDDVKRRVEASEHDRVEVEWITVDVGKFAAARTDARLPASTLYRLLMPSALPADLDRAIYLDCDLLARRDLAPLWSKSLDGSPCGAVRDARIVSIGTPDGPPWRALDLDPHAPYFNAGVLLVDLGIWRSEHIGARALEAMRTSPIPQNDQGALNAVLCGRWKPLEPRWNLQGSHIVDRNNFAWAVEPTGELEAAYADPAIVHFSGLRKPWNPRCVHPYRDAWLTALQHTAWADWTPPRATVRRTIGRARRTVDTLLGRRGSGDR